MKFRKNFQFIFLSLMLLLIGALLTFSDKGILEMHRLNQQMEKTKSNISILNDSNREFRRRLDLFKSPVGADLIETQARERYSWVKEGETVYTKN